MTTGVTRRDVLGRLGGALASVACPGIARAQAPTRPNIILLLADDQRWDTLGVYGNATIKTPHLDRLARQGAVFSRAYVTTSICPTSRASIWLGQHARRHGIVNFDRAIDEQQYRASLPALLRAAGYHVGFIGKYGIGPRYPDDKFDWIDAYNGQGSYRQPSAAGGWRHLTQLQGDKALEFLDWRPKDGPFFLQVSFKAPHPEPPGFIANPDDAGLYADEQIPFGFDLGGGRFVDLPEFLRADSLGRQQWLDWFETPGPQGALRDYYRLVTDLDRQAGRILEALRREGLANTIIVFTSDNGFYLGEHGLAGKWLGHEPSIRVPLVIADLRMEAAATARMVPELALNIDIAPTLLTLAGAARPDGMQGFDLSWALTGARPEQWREDFLYEFLFEHPGIPECVGVVGQRHKYMRYRRRGGEYEELFDLQDDPRERINVAGRPQARDLLDALRARTERLAALAK